MPQPRRRASRLAVVALAFVAGCGSATRDQLVEPTATSTYPSTPPPSPSPTTAPASVEPSATTVVLRDGDTGTTVHVNVGQRIRVVLERDTWDPPTSSAAAVVVRRSSSGGYPTDKPVDALFEAVRTGTADLSASTDAACFHTEPRCLMPTRLWQVHVVVS